MKFIQLHKKESAVFSHIFFTKRLKTDNDEKDLFYGIVVEDLEQERQK
ncbi:hypothetical protein [Enterococcus sp.]|nr:hypothetical protein [Enterococcus sp.]